METDPNQASERALEIGIIAIFTAAAVCAVTTTTNWNISVAFGMRQPDAAAPSNAPPTENLVVETARLIP